MNSTDQQPTGQTSTNGQFSFPSKITNLLHFQNADLCWANQAVPTSTDVQRVYLNRIIGARRLFVESHLTSFVCRWRSTWRGWISTVLMAWWATDSHQFPWEQGLLPRLVNPSAPRSGSRENGIKKKETTISPCLRTTPKTFWLLLSSGQFAVQSHIHFAFRSSMDLARMPPSK